MKEYKIFKIRYKMEDTENKINVLAKEGWKVVCSYGLDNFYIIMEREEKK